MVSEVGLFIWRMIAMQCKQCPILCDDPELLPDGATLLRVQLWPFLAFEVRGKLRQVCKGSIHPPRSREVASAALGWSYQVISSENGFLSQIYPTHRITIENSVIAAIPPTQCAPVKCVTHLWNITGIIFGKYLGNIWEISQESYLVRGKTNVTQNSWSEVRLKPGTHSFSDALRLLYARYAA